MMESLWHAVTNKVIFHSSKMFNDKSLEFAPCPAAKVVPKWWHDADMYIKDEDGNPLANWSGKGKMPGFKACPAILDGFTTGYVLRTPCDMEFYEKRGRVKVKLPVGFEDFVGERPPIDGFMVPHGYDAQHFHWFANWGPELPEGYSMLYIPPMNAFELPFVTVAGIIDSDKVTNSGLIPFFLRQGFTGIIPAGTPYLQMIPFKRDDWEMEIITYKPEEIFKKHRENAKIFRTEEGGVYKKLFWTRRKYK